MSLKRRSAPAGVVILSSFAMGGAIDCEQTTSAFAESIRLSPNASTSIPVVVEHVEEAPASLVQGGPVRLAVSGNIRVADIGEPRITGRLVREQAGGAPLELTLLRIEDVRQQDGVLDLSFVSDTEVTMLAECAALSPCRDEVLLTFQYMGGEGAEAAVANLSAFIPSGSVFAPDLDVTIVTEPVDGEQQP